MTTRSFLASSAFLAALFLAQPSIAPAAQPDTPSAIASATNPAAVPASRLNEAWWAQRHHDVLAGAASHSDAEVVFLGDSTFNNYDLATPPERDFRSVWTQFYAPRRALNLGFRGDTTSNVLWRIDHGELDGLSPRAIVLLIGGANTRLDHQTALQTADGIDAVVGDVARHLPETRIVLIGLLPSGVSTALAARDQEVNTRLETLFAGDRRVLYLDIGAIFYNGGGLNTAMFCPPSAPGQPLQPNTLGQLSLAEAIEPALANLLGDTPRFPRPTLEQTVQQASAR